MRLNGKAFRIILTTIKGWPTEGKNWAGITNRWRLVYYYQLLAVETE